MRRGLTSERLDVGDRLAALSRGSRGSGHGCPPRPGALPALGRCHRLRGALAVVGAGQELGRGAQPVPASGPTGRKSLPACGGDSLAERAPPALLQIS